MSGSNADDLLTPSSKSTLWKRYWVNPEPSLVLKPEQYNGTPGTPCISKTSFKAIMKKKL